MCIIHNGFRGFQAIFPESNLVQLQLTTDKKRPEAFKFYEKLGFIASHEGMKLHFKK